MDINKLRGNPFYLTDEDIGWVQKTFSGMSQSDKIGQLFFLIA